jgi:hypothetical protein
MYFVPHSHSPGADAFVAESAGKDVEKSSERCYIMKLWKTTTTTISFQ